jgi:hypothetical protein
MQHGGFPFHVTGAYNPSDRGSNAGGNHLIVDALLDVGRLHRQPGDPLCKPARNFWGLTGDLRGSVTCHKCAEIALRLGLPFDGRLHLDVGRSWSTVLVIDKGKPSHIFLRSHWFRVPPVVPPTPPTEEWLLRAVRFIHPHAAQVTLRQMGPDPEDPTHLQGEATIV